MSDSPFIVEITAENFASEIVERSNTVPVLVDFWAPWCGPCRQLTPILEKLANEYQGRFVLAKVNTEEQQMLAAQFGIQSIPQVFVIDRGQPVTQFQGLKPEAEIRQLLEQIVPSPEIELLQQAGAIEAENPAEAERLYRQVLETVSDSAPANIGLARVLMAQGHLDDAAAVLETLESRGFLEPEAETLKSELELRRGAEESGGVQAAREAVAANPEDDGLKLQLADALAAGRKYDEACEICLDIFSRTKSDDARNALIRILDLMPPGDASTKHRRRLANLMY